MKALVTGGAGFIGSHLVEQLITTGAQVHVIDDMSSGRQINIHPLAIVHQVDLSSLAARQIILAIKPDIVFHLAAQADVSKSVIAPKEDGVVNIIGTINLLEACHEAAVKKVIFSSTSAVYGNLNKELISEKDQTKPASYYGLSKLTAELYIRLFHRFHGLPYTILRYGNVYGPRQQAKGEGGVVAVFINQLQKGLPLHIHGDGEQTRDFIYVKDVVHANLAAIDRGDQETIHISTSQKTSVNQLVHMLSQIHGDNVNATYTAERNGDIKHSCLDNEKAHRILTWQPQFDCQRGLKETFLFAQHSG